jgi:hypothetical protein
MQGTHKDANHVLVMVMGQSARQRKDSFLLTLPLISLVCAGRVAVYPETTIWPKN